jgi:hypothetical protein
VADAVVAAGFAGGRVLQPVQRALAGQRRAVGTPRFQLAGEDGQRRVVPQPVMVHQVLVAERDAEHALPDEGGHVVLHALHGASVAEAGGEAPDQPDGAVGGAEQQRAGVRGDRPAVEAGDHGAALDRCKLKQGWVMLCPHRRFPLRRRKALSQRNLRRFRAPMHLRLVRNAG